MEKYLLDMDFCSATPISIFNSESGKYEQVEIDLLEISDGLKETLYYYMMMWENAYDSSFSNTVVHSSNSILTDGMKEITQHLASALRDELKADVIFI